MKDENFTAAKKRHRADILDDGAVRDPIVPNDLNDDDKGEVRPVQPQGPAVFDLEDDDWQRLRVLPVRKARR